MSRFSEEMRQRRPCRWCKKGYKRIMLDSDGTDCAISERVGIWGHARDDHFWPCETDYAIPENILNIASSRLYDMSRYRDPFEALQATEDAELRRNEVR